MPGIGISISDDKMDYLFKSLSQIDSSTTRKYGGTGRRLAISKNLIELRGGEVSVTSVLSEGSQFAFSLELSIPDAEETGVPAKKQDEAEEVMPVFPEPLAQQECVVEIPRAEPSDEPPRRM